MLNGWKKRVAACALIPWMMLALMLPSIASASALSASDFVSVSKNKSYNKDGKFWMSFNLQNVAASGSTVHFSAKVQNASGKTVFTWNGKTYGSGEGGTRNFGANYAKMPSGTYTFTLTAAAEHNAISNADKPKWTWKYNINHTAPSGLSFKSYEQTLNDSGAQRHKFTISSTGAKGRSIVIRILDSSGMLVWLKEGPEIKTDSSSTWFKWDGWSDIGSGYKCTSGEYTVHAYFSGDSNVIEKTYNLKIV